MFGSVQEDGPDKQAKTSSTIHATSNRGQEGLPDHLTLADVEVPRTPGGAPRKDRRFAKLRIATQHHEDDEKGQKSSETISTSLIPDPQPCLPWAVHAFQEAQSIGELQSGDASRIIMATGPSYSRPALLMNEEILEAMKVSIEAWRTACLERLKCDARNVVLNEFQAYAREELADLRDRAQHALPRMRPALIGEANQLELKLQQAQEDSEQTKARGLWFDEEGMLKSLAANMLIADAFVTHGLMKPETPHGKIEPEEDIADYFAVPEPIWLRRESPDPEKPQFTQQDLDELHAFEMLTTTREELKQAQANFDHRDRQTGAKYRRRLDHGEDDMLAYDLQQFEHDNMRTRELVEAEERYAEANAVAVALKLDINIDPSQKSGFQDADGDLDPEAPLSGINHAGVGPRSTGKIAEWLTTLPPVAIHDVPQAEIEPSEPELDTWSMRAIANWESISTVDCGTKVEKEKLAMEGRRIGAVAAWCEAYKKRTMETFEKWHASRR